MENTSTISKLPTSTRRSPAREALRHLWKHSSGKAGIIILSLLVLIAIFAPLIAPYDPTQLLKDQKRRDVLVESFGRAGWEIPSPKASMFAWAPLPPALKSSERTGTKKSGMNFSSRSLHVPYRFVAPHSMRFIASANPFRDTV